MYGGDRPNQIRGGGSERERGWEGKGGEAFILCQFVLIEALSNVKYQFEIIFASEWGGGGNSK